MVAPRVTFARRHAQRILTDTCVVNSVTQTPTDMGGYTEGLTPVATVACRIRPVTGNERITGGAVVEDATAVARLPAGTVVTPQQVITSGGREYRVLYVPDSTEQLLLDCFCSERIT